MSVAVMSKTSMRLMPTSEYRARKLLKSKKATVYGYHPFTIQLTERETGDVQPVELCMDTGYLHIGMSVKSKKHEYLGVQIDTLTDEKQKHDACRMYRRQRRSRKRYRQSRFNNRKRSDGWIAPSLEHKKDIHIQTISRICNAIPITNITLEMGNFDTQVLKALKKNRPLPQGTDYQHGERYGIATLREAVFARDKYTCQCCRRTIADGAILHVHHIIYRSRGGTNRMSNLATVCDRCHTPANHKPGGKLYNWKPKLASFKGRAFDITKSHVNDAFVMGQFHPKHRSRPVCYKKKRRNNRCLEKFYDAKYIDSRDGKKRSGQELFNGRINRNHKKDSENLHQYRQQKVSSGRRTIRKQHYSIQPHDIVVFNRQQFETSGCHCNGARAILLPQKKSVAIKKLSIHKYAGGYFKSDFT